MPHISPAEKVKTSVNLLFCTFHFNTKHILKEIHIKIQESWKSELEISVLTELKHSQNANGGGQSIPLLWNKTFNQNGETSVPQKHILTEN